MSNPPQRKRKGWTCGWPAQDWQAYLCLLLPRNSNWYVDFREFKDIMPTQKHRKVVLAFISQRHFFWVEFVNSAFEHSWPWLWVCCGCKKFEIDTNWYQSICWMLPLGFDSNFCSNCNGVLDLHEGFDHIRVLTLERYDWTKKCSSCETVIYYSGIDHGIFWLWCVENG